LAEGRGFEPPVALRLLLISSQMPLTTQPPFHSFVFNAFIAFCPFLIDFGILVWYTVPIMNDSISQNPYQKSPVANLYSYVPTGVYYAKARIGGKIKKKCLNTNVFSVAKLRLADYLKEEHRKAESLDNAVRGKMTFGDAMQAFKVRLDADKALKPRSKAYRLERLDALLRS
jgi:hypothetical protein